MVVIHNTLISKLVSGGWKVDTVQDLQISLSEHRTFEFPVLETGLFSASALAGEGAEYTGYASAWVRDNIHVAHAHYVVGERHIAVKNIESLIRYFSKHQGRFAAAIRSNQTPASVMERPHIRFDGRTLKEIDQTWAHAQNDALGYFLWFICKLAFAGDFKLTSEHCAVLALFPLYFQAVRYWEDEDSGHWEEERKIEASSIGAVVAGLELLKQVLSQLEIDASFFTFENHTITISLLDDLIHRGRNVLEAILPSECIQPDKARRYDSALLFLIYPLSAVDGSMADQILNDVIHNLQGDYGIKRYIGDSFWAADYKEKLSPESRTVDFSDDMSARDALLKEGEEAQWCIFDPIISVIFGLKYQTTQQVKDLEQQIYYFNRSLGQLTAEDSPFGELKCPEAYYLEKGRYVPNDVTPLLWTQANLMLAFHHLDNSLKMG